MAAVLYHVGRFPPAALDSLRLIPLTGPTASARYDGMLAAVPNSSVLLAPLTTQEAAVLSSRIEGTQATVGEVLGIGLMHMESGKARLLLPLRETMRHKRACQSPLSDTRGEDF